MPCQPLKSGVLLACLFLATPTPADLLEVVARDVSSTLGTPDGLRTWRFSAVFSDPTNQVIAVAADPDVFAPIVFSTTDPRGLRNDGGVFAGLKAEDFAQFPMSAAWDSWVTIGADSFSDTDYSPLFLHNDGVNAFIVGAEWSEFEGGWFDSEPGTAETGLEVLLAQFTVGESFSVELSGNVVYVPGGCCKPVFGAFDASTSKPCSPVGCAADLDFDGGVGFPDLLIILDAWGSCSERCCSDIDADGEVGMSDVATLLQAWGACRS